MLVYIIIVKPVLANYQQRKLVSLHIFSFKLKNSFKTTNKNVNHPTGKKTLNLYGKKSVQMAQKSYDSNKVTP